MQTKILEINSLPTNKEWVDRDDIMLHACFQILEDFIVKENGDTHCNYEAHKDFVDELRFLFKWWQDRVKKGLDDSDNQMKEDDEMLIRLMKIRCALWT